jgi:hypothetical protein
LKTPVENAPRTSVEKHLSWSSDIPPAARLPLHRSRPAEYQRSARRGAVSEVGGPCAATRERERESERERERDRERERERESTRESESEGESVRERKGARASESENERREHTREGARPSERERESEQERESEHGRARAMSRASEKERERVRERARTRGEMHSIERARTSKRGSEKNEERGIAACTTTTAMGASWARTGALARHRRPGEDRHDGCTCSAVVRRGTARGSSYQRRH